MVGFRPTCDRGAHGSGAFGFGIQRSLSACAREKQSRLRDFCKAKAEVIFACEAAPALRGFLTPFEDD